MKSVLAFIRYLLRVVRWWFKCLWVGEVVPRKEAKLFSRSVMRRAWRERLRALDRQVNDLTLRGKPLGFLLVERKIMVAKRRLYRVE